MSCKADMQKLYVQEERGYGIDYCEILMQSVLKNVWGESLELVFEDVYFLNVERRKTKYAGMTHCVEVLLYWTQDCKCLCDVFENFDH